jgi:hypothetical protein
MGFSVAVLLRYLRLEKSKEQRIQLTGVRIMSRSKSSAPWFSTKGFWSSLARQGPFAQRPRLRPEVLQLEDRVVPSVNVASTFLGMNFGDTPGYVPPDTIAASGPTEIIETVNTDIAIYNKSGGAILSPTNLATFFQSVGPINQLSDSAVAYDELRGTFFVSVLNITLDIFFGNPSADSFLYAVSNNNSPASASDFTFHSVDLTGLDPAGSGSFWADFPRIGWNANAYVASFNMFTNGIFTQNYDHALVLNLEVTAPSSGTLALVPGGTANGTLAPATMHGSAATDPMYLVEESSTSPGKAITIVAETNLFNFVTGPSFTFKDVALPAVADYIAPPAATQKGSTTQTISTNDSRILNAEWRNNHLVAAHAIGVTTDAQAHARWYEFDTTNYTSTGPTLIQAGTIGLGSGANSYFPSIAIGANDALGMTYMESSPTEYMSMYVAGRLASDAPGTMETTSLAAQPGQAPYTGFPGVEASPPFRAGDFSGTTVDPNDGTFWSANEYASSNTSLAANWGTAISHFSLTSSLSPITVSASALPNPVLAGTMTALVATATDPNVGATITRYTWSVQSGPSGVTFASNNGTSLGSSVTANFSQAGSYTFLVTVIDSLGATGSNTVNLTVQQVLSSITVAPSMVTVADNNTKQFTATAFDQFGKAMTTQPSFTWTVDITGAGSISSSGVYVAPASGHGTDTVRATAGAVSGTATVTYAQPPTITSASATPNPVTGKTTQLTAVATDPNGVGGLVYKWSLSSGPAGVTFGSNNGTTSGNSVTATFSKAGSYMFLVTVTDSFGVSSTQSVTVTVGQTLTSVTVSPATASIRVGRTQQFTAKAFDQFGNALITQPTFTWAVMSGPGTINNNGLYTGTSTGTAVIQATAVGTTISGTATVTVRRR